MSTQTNQAGSFGTLVAVLPAVVEADHSAGMAALDRAARRKLGISAEEFLAKWDAGDYVGADENVRAQEVAMLLPLVRATLANAR
ncbi:hypothetical protein ACFV4G_02240 [Kitasatospora sp. NPDC059747]|uniref:hypothetical protein n=1 Tax=Kitasatospora sp. NPDC059747 TaxID=3346930 RepID=UPI0036483F74